MTEDQLESVVETFARSAAAVLCRALKSEKRFKHNRFLVSAADEVELREYLKAWALAKRSTD